MKLTPAQENNNEAFLLVQREIQEASHRNSLETFGEQFDTENEREDEYI